MNGPDTLIAIRGEFPDARIIILTTSESDGEIQRALRAGAVFTLNEVTRLYGLRWRCFTRSGCHS